MVCFNFWCSSSDKRVPLTTRTPSEYMDFCDSPCRDFTGVAEHLLSPSENHRPLMITDSCTMTCYWPIWGWGRLHCYLQGHGEISTGVSRRQLDSLYTPESGNRPPPSFQLRLQKNHGINVTFVSLVKRVVGARIWLSDELYASLSSYSIFSSAGLPLDTTNSIPFPRQQCGTQLSSQTQHKSVPFRWNSKVQIQAQKANFVDSPGSVVLQLNKDPATSLLAFIIKRSFLNGVLKMVLSDLKRDRRPLFPALFRIPPLKLPNKAKCQHSFQL